MKIFSRGKKRSLLAVSAIMLAMLALSVGATAAFAQGSPIQAGRDRESSVSMIQDCEPAELHG